MVKSKLHKLLRLRELRERQSQQALAASIAEHQRLQQEVDSFSSMVDEYLCEHRTCVETNSHKLAMFRSFYEKLDNAAKVQLQALNHAQHAERTVRAHHLGHVQNRRLLEKSIEHREMVHKKEAKVKERRNQLPPPSKAIV